MSILKYVCTVALLIEIMLAHQAYAQKDYSARKFPLHLSSISVSATNGAMSSPAPFSHYKIRLPNCETYCANILIGKNRLTFRDSIFGVPTFGIGICQPKLHMDDIFGEPTSVYFIYSATLLGIGKKTSIRYYGKIGASFGWNPYDYDTNPHNKAIGSDINYHAEANIFFDIRLYKPIALKIGGSFTHFSDGAYHLPNGGLNLVGFFGGLSCDFDYKRIKPFYIEPERRRYKPHYELDIEGQASYREVKQEAENSDRLGNIYHPFKMYNLASYLMYTKSRHVRIGIGLQGYYDESSNIKAYKIIDEDENGKQKNVNDDEEEDDNRGGYSYTPSETKDRFGAGIFGRLDLPMGYINAIVDVGYIFDNGAFNSNVFALNLALKSYIYRSSYIYFGLRSVPSNKMVNTFIGLGYSFNQGRYRIKKNE